MKKVLVIGLTVFACLTSSLSAEIYTVSVPSLTGMYQIDPAHDIELIFDDNWAGVVFPVSFSDPLAAIRIEISGQMTFQKFIDATDSSIHESAPANNFQIGPDIKMPWLQTGVPSGLSSFSWSRNDGSGYGEFSIDGSGNFYASRILNNTGMSSGSTFFNSFDDGSGGFSMAYGYVDPYWLGQPNWSFYEAGSVNVASIQLSVSTTDFFQPTVVPEPISSALFIAGGTLLAGRRYFRRKKGA